jgi:quinol monooxygenase YgiN
VLVVLSSATAAPGHRDELVAAARDVAAATRLDDGCLTYSFSADLEDPDRILGVEVWADRAALDAHLGHPHTERFLQAVPDLVAGAPAMAFYEVPATETGTRRGPAVT